MARHGLELVLADNPNLAKAIVFRHAFAVPVKGTTLTKRFTKKSCIAPPPLPLFVWASAEATRIRRQRAPIRLMMLEAYRDADGQPRVALAVPGSRLPVVYPSLSAALAAKARMEATP